MSVTPAKIAVLMLTEILLRENGHEDIFVVELLDVISKVGEQARIRAEVQQNDAFSPFVFSKEEAQSATKEIFEPWKKSGWISEWANLDVISIRSLKDLQSDLRMKLSQIDPEGERRLLTPLVSRLVGLYKSMTRNRGYN